MKGKPIAYREPTRPLHPIVHALRKRRYDLDLTAEEVAHRAGYDLQTLQAWEHGGSRPAFASIEAWAESLGLTLTLKEKQ